MGKTRYDDKTRAASVAFMIGLGYPDNKGAIEETAKHTGIPKSTLRGWADGTSNPPPEEVVGEQKLELSVAIRSEISALLKEMQRARETASYRDLGIVFGVLVDKLQLLNDEPTENINAQISFIRSGLSTLPESTTPSAIADTSGAQTV